MLTDAVGFELHIHAVIQHSVENLGYRSSLEHNSMSGFCYCMLLLAPTTAGQFANGQFDNRAVRCKGIHSV